MCGIIGFKGLSTPQNVALLQRLLEESQIRGKHATGVSYISNQQIKTLKEGIPAKVFITKYWDTIFKDLSQELEISFIAHTRYSTSGIEHNQPHADEQLSVAFNGVITQADSSMWESLYGFKPQTTNDVEILHHVICRAGNPIAELGTASMAVVMLKKNGVVGAFRNGTRPMYVAVAKNGSLILASTKQVLLRANSEYHSLDIIPPDNMHYLYNKDGHFVAQYENKDNIIFKDMQTMRFV